MRRRSVLVVPGSAPEKLARAAERGADELVVDLEDAVLPDAKDAARDALAGSLAPGMSVRVNGRGTPWHEADVAAVAGSAASIVVPKVEGPEDLAGVAGLRVQALIETATGLARAGEIAAAPGVEALILGYADLGASLGRRSTDPVLWDAARELVLVAARTNGVQAIDGPWLGIRDDEAFRAAAARARDQGFDGKWAIHPAQVAALNELFSSSEDDVAWARRVIGALDEAGQGAVALDGQMLDEAVRVQALRILDRA